MVNAASEGFQSFRFVLNQNFLKIEILANFIKAAEFGRILDNFKTPKSLTLNLPKSFFSRTNSGQV